MPATIFAKRRGRAAELRDRHEHATEILELYLVLLEPQARLYARALADRPSAADLPAYAVRHGLSGVMDATMAKGTETLREGVLQRFHEAALDDVVRRWVAGDEQSPVDRFLARAAAGPILEAFPEAAAPPREPSQRRCPACGGRPQLAVFTESGEALVTGERELECSRCARRWRYPRLTCAGCGETATSRMPIFAAHSDLPHLRIDACESCRQYLITVDLRKDPAAVPVVDELVAAPLDLHAADRGFTKIAPNLMGF